jgi:hypothetical protein
VICAGLVRSGDEKEEVVDNGVPVSYEHKERKVEIGHLSRLLKVFDDRCPGTAFGLRQIALTKCECPTKNAIKM